MNIHFNYIIYLYRDSSVPISVCYRHNGSVRTDKRQKFSEEDCKNGGNNSILTYHFLAELAFKLGFTAKFGA